MKPSRIALFLLVSALSYAQDTSTLVENQLKTVDRTVAAGPFHDDVDSLKHMQVPDWFRDAKFGIFIHWGAYSVPAWGNEWYPRNMYQPGSPEFAHQVATYGPQNKFGYKDFLSQFTGEHFDAKQWADLFKRAGARYVIEVAEHHDGFAMYDTQFSDWKATRMGPHRDVIGELSSAVRADGLHFGVSFHRAEHWWFFDGGRQFDSDVRDPQYDSFYGPAQPWHTPDNKDNQPTEAFVRNWLARSTELVDKYHPELFYFDWWVGQPAFQPSEKKFAAYYYDRAASAHQPVVFFYKEQAMPPGTAVHDVERGKLASIQPDPWQTDTSISYKSWGYLAKDDALRTPKSIVQDLVDIVSKNGCLLLNIGPKPDGTIPEDEQKILLAVGDWLRANSDAIYGSRPWQLYGEGPTQVIEGGLKEGEQKPFTAEDIRFLQNRGKLYAIPLDTPPSGKVIIHTLDAKSHPVRAVKVVGSTAAVKFTQDAAGLHLQIPEGTSPLLLPVFEIESK
jgi:alpha-L-fucosidase